jgi:peptidoglycan DL-endopeptidase CwlO
VCESCRNLAFGAPALWYVRPVLGQAHARLRLLGIAFVAIAAAAAPAAAGSDPGGRAAALRAENDRLAAQTRSAVLDLYALDSRLQAARAQLDSLRADARRLRVERARLVEARRLARLGIRSSQQQLAARIRQLYEAGEVSPIEVVLGARSLTDALTQLDNVDRVASLNDDVIEQLRAARTRLARVSKILAARTARLVAALRAAAAAEESLAWTRAARAEYVARLGRQRDLNAAAIARLESQARAAQARALALAPVGSEAAVAAAPTLVAATGPAGARSLTVTITGYALTGRTATGLPVGYGVAAVDPRVIPLGTHILVPGYGDAVAADVGGGIVGSRVDVWFPTEAQAHAWGLRTVRIALH